MERNAKNKLKIVTLEITEPAANSNVKALWDRTNDMIISWLLNTITDQIGNSLSYINSAAALWKELQEHYSQLDGHGIYQLANEISQLKQENCTVEVYYQKLKGYWDELDALEAPYMCTCVCNCVNGRVNGEKEQRKRLMQFLMGLDYECYSNVMGQILLMQPMPNAAKAYGMIRQEEKQKEQHSIKPSTSIALFMQTNSRNNSKWNSQRPAVNYNKSPFKKGVFCGKCNLERHIKEECYKIVGYSVGHSLHDKFKPASINNTLPLKSVDMVTSAEGNIHNEAAMSARMDQLQNQLNQVLMMMQANQQEQPTAGIHKLIASHINAQRYKFTASIISHYKDARIIDSGATDHDHNKRIAHGTLCDDLYVIQQAKAYQNHSIIQITTNHPPVTDEALLWHSRLGHSSFQQNKINYLLVKANLMPFLYIL
ncbi:uncharacterized protein [Rutidosis leptorrhynchoides]|uniref:uncharacterized protein n=1 Tax=Rutidosis leptorrhynchoides TaxID=125765 RepID=UPI003A991F05